MGYIRNVFAAVLFLITAAICGAESGADIPDSVIVMRFHISYPVNSVDIHEDYMGNALLFSRINEYLQKSTRIDSIIINSSASPEGSYSLNRRLARERGIRAKEYISRHLPEGRYIPDSIVFFNHTTENWEGLHELVEREYMLDDKSEVLSILERKDITDERRKSLLKRLDKGRSWEYMKENMFPQLRYATWTTVWAKIRNENDLEKISSDECMSMAEPVKQTGLALPSLVQLPCTADDAIPEVKEVELALRTNILYDAMSLLNYSIEVPFLRNKASVLLYHQFPWWTWGRYDNEFCIRDLSLGGEVRWWFFRGERSFTGHFLGVYGESGKYDFQFRKNFCYQGEFWSTGLSYGYAMPVGERLHLEFSLSAGFASIPYRGYTPGEDYEHLWRDPDKVGRLSYFGPTKAQVTLVVPISVKIGKGGER